VYSFSLKFTWVLMQIQNLGIVIVFMAVIPIKPNERSTIFGGAPPMISLLKITPRVTNMTT